MLIIYIVEWYIFVIHIIDYNKNITHIISADKV